MAAKRIFDKKRGVLNTIGATTATFDIAVPTDTAVGFSAKIIAKETTTMLGAYIEKAGSISNAGGTVALSNTVAVVANVLDATLATATAVFTANGTDLRLTVTGVALLTIDWQYEISIIQN